MNNLNKLFSSRLKNILIQRKISHTFLSKEFDLTQATVSRWVNGVGFPTMDKMVLLADYLNLSVDYLLCRTDNKETGATFTMPYEAQEPSVAYALNTEKEALKAEITELKKELDHVKRELISQRELNDHKTDLITLYKERIDTLKES